MPKMWMVRADSHGILFDDFKEKKAVAIGWEDMGSLETLASRDEIANRVKDTWPGSTLQWRRMSTSQVSRFRFELQSNDNVITYHPGRRLYLVGKVVGQYSYKPTLIREDKPNIIPVEWSGEVSRDLLSVSTRNSLGAISTLFLVPEHAAIDVLDVLGAEKSPIDIAEIKGNAPGEDEIEETNLVEDVQSRAVELAKDKIIKLDWKEMQNLVAGLLRAMGYKTRVSAEGPDRGKDIVASPDGFGFETPRVVVEVKHRTKEPMGSQQIRSFLGGRHPDDKGLYVSTGGFSKDAKYEAERANIPVFLMDLDGLVEAIIDNYDSLDISTKQLIPLKKVYWPL